MKKELELMEKWCKIIVVISVVGALLYSLILMVNNGTAGFILLLVSAISIGLTSLPFYFMCTHIKGQNIIIEQNKEIITQLTKQNEHME